MKNFIGTVTTLNDGDKIERLQAPDFSSAILILEKRYEDIGGSVIRMECAVCHSLSYAGTDNCRCPTPAG